MSDDNAAVERIVASIEKKLETLQSERQALGDRIQRKRAQIEELENTLDKLRAVEAKLSS